ncbi:TIGR00341 family protein [Thermaurantiacus tibetensis]|uniref:TIGR00341 family protein n=1 Tax=Thermaurantiacus tibetensis TaxID=2759035 RepID=UPI00188E2571|nr:TIGR00341 family protein [Thermaurantiacus tibetensis]
MNVETAPRQPPNSLAARAQRGLERAFLALRPPHLLDEIDHPSILARVEADAGWTPRYAFMVLMSAGIAILGLLLSSPAVIIGAMLVSPLMGPIIGLGFAIAVFDWAQVRKSLLALAAGALLAVAFASLIVFLSPLTDRTSEIMARTRPSLFDLLVAIFSALAGGYATIRGRGETIVGVAIATALMPPLAVVGFGLATADWPVFTGALALFVTNFVAIALSATIMAKFYGFGSRLSPEQSRRQGWGILAVFLLLAIPLGVSLRQIAEETLFTRTVRDAILSEFGREVRIESLDPEFGTTPVEVRAVVLTPAFRADAVQKITQQLEGRVGMPFALSLHQVVLDQDPRTLRPALAEAGRPGPVELAAAALRDQLALATGATDITIDRDSRRALVRLPVGQTLPLAEVRNLERRLAARYPDWEVRLVPPFGPLPPLGFAAGSAEPDAEAVDTIGWTLARWRIPEVRVEGRAASDEPADLARARAEAVAEGLARSGVSATGDAALRDAASGALERERGRAALRTATVIAGA